MPQMMPMLWTYLFLLTFFLLMILVTLIYYLYTPVVLTSFNYKVTSLNWFWLW
uniref:ATP synthase F0 subunit 8 n=1 Tax=Myrmica scabrinodis TaxID=207696 RepID=A0A0A8P128_9HYME|nr:ATP synthase F0 subunit 8 [Myrmica scabrinodis]CEF49543.1 ATP synthase F0 subunit 8 [Myrmica scabrinodis]